MLKAAFEGARHLTEPDGPVQVRDFRVDFDRTRRVTVYRYELRGVPCAASGFTAESPGGSVRWLVRAVTGDTAARLPAGGCVTERMLVEEAARLFLEVEKLEAA